MITKENIKTKYYYVSELKSICKELGLSHSGTKLDLQNRILHFLDTGEKSSQKFKQNSSKSIPVEINLETNFITGGLKFNLALRNFIKKTTGVNKVSFTKYMGHAVRSAKEKNEDITVQGLIDIFMTPKSEQKLLLEDETYQWNNFVKDFTQSPESKNYTNKLKVASIIWKEVRESSYEKVYTCELLSRYDSLIEEYRNEV